MIDVISQSDREVAIVSIHDHELPRGQHFDLKDILSALGERAVRWQWCVMYDFEAVGERISGLEQLIWQARPGGYWLSDVEFRAFAQNIQQTIDGEFQAFPSEMEPGSVPVAELRMRFPESRAELAIHIIDGTSLKCTQSTGAT